jgi:pre-mRNA-processing factor SLU7
MSDKKEIDLEHMPKFIKEAPWYLSKDGVNQKEETILFHQRIEHDKRQNIDNWYQKGYRKQPIVTKFRKGACENCGAISHKTKECLERPRKVGAKWTERDIARDEYDTN